MKSDKKNSNTYNFDVDFSYVPEFKEGKVDKNSLPKEKIEENKDNRKEKDNE